MVSPVQPTDDAEFLLAGMAYVTKITDPKVVIEKLVTSASAALGSDMGSFYALNPEKQVLEPYVMVNFPTEYAAACSSVPLGEQCCGRAAKHKLPWIVEDMWTDPLFAGVAAEGAKKVGIRSAFSVPVLGFDGNCLGSLASHFRIKFVPTSYDLERQALFAKLIAFALRKSEANHNLLAQAG